METKSVKDSLLGRRSVRRFEREAVTSEQLDFIYEAIRNTPTSYNGQQYSVIDVTDQALKEQLAAIIGQRQIKTCNHFMAFCADFNKIFTFARARGIDFVNFDRTMDGLIVGTVDAALAMMSAVAAVESLGLGCCCIGYARTAAPEEVNRLLNLPPDTYLVCGLSIGVPREMPDLKPKQPASLLIHHNRYRSDDMLPDLEKYDAVIREYNLTRSGETTDNDWLTHILSYYREAMGHEMGSFLRSKGFLAER